MKKYSRQRMILDLIDQFEIKTQDELAEKLKDNGVIATQATISRDIKELRISKVQAPDGEYKYTILDTVHDSLNDRIDKMFKSACLSVDHNGEMVIVKTIAYSANICALRITNAKIDNVAGIVSGHDTIFMAVDDHKYLDDVVNAVKELMQ